jgi:hypothetical protein
MPGVDPSKHSIVYMSDTRPRLASTEPTPTKDPIEVDPERFEERLHRKSRLNFGRIYTVEHNVKVLPIGEISEASMPKFVAYARAELETGAGSVTVQSRGRERTSQPPGGRMHPSHRPGRRGQPPIYEINRYGAFERSSPGETDRYGETESDDYMTESYDDEQDHPQDQYQSHSRYTEYETDDNIPWFQDYYLDDHRQSHSAYTDPTDPLYGSSARNIYRSRNTDPLDPLSALSASRIYHFRDTDPLEPLSASSAMSNYGQSRARPTPAPTDTSQMSRQRHSRGP